MLWPVALITLLIRQAFNFTLFGGNYRRAQQSGTRDADAALRTRDNWDSFHKVRTASVCASALAMAIIFMRSRGGSLQPRRTGRDTSRKRQPRVWQRDLVGRAGA